MSPVTIGFLQNIRECPKEQEAQDPQSTKIGCLCGKMIEILGMSEEWELPTEILPAMPPNATCH